MNSVAPTKADYRVVIYAVPEDPQDLAQVLTEVLEMHATDAIVHARHAPGILPDRLTREQADRLAAAIEKIGISANVATIDEIPDFDHSQTVHHCQWSDSAMEIFGTQAAVEHRIPWNDIELICVGVVPQESARHYLTGEMSVLSAARRSPHDPLNIPPTAGPELWFVRRNPFHVFCIDHKRMNYECLGYSKTDSATANFQLFLRDLLQHAPGAYVTPSTRAFLDHGPDREFQFDSTDHLQRYAQLHLMIHRHASSGRGEQS
jgi:hypothetical protein